MDAEAEIYLQNISQVPELSAQAERLLAQKAQAGDARACQQLVEPHLKVGAEMAVEFHSKEAWRGLTLKEAIHAANTGLFLAARRFTSTAEMRFSDYARPFVLRQLEQLAVEKG